MTNLSIGSSAKLPTGDGNGLTNIVDQLDRTPKRIRVAVVLLDVAGYDTRVDDGVRTLKTRIRRIEAITDPDDAAAMERILMREFERRTQLTVLPLDLETDVMNAFAELRADMPTIGDGEHHWEDGQKPSERDNTDPDAQDDEDTDPPDH